MLKQGGTDGIEKIVRAANHCSVKNLKDAAKEKKYFRVKIREQESENSRR